MNHLFIYFEDPAKGSDIADYIASYKLQQIGSRKFIVTTDRAFRSMVANFWNHMGERGFLYVIDLAHPQMQIAYPADHRVARKFDARRKKVYRDFEKYQNACEDE